MVDRFGTPSSGVAVVAGNPTSVLTAEGDPAALILQIVRDDPFATINQIKRELNSRAAGRERLTWWQVFSMLRRRGLLTKRSRFRYVWGRH